MKRKFTFLLLILIFTIPINAANVLLWNYNPGDASYPNGYDVHTDPEAGGEQVDCSYWLKATLDSNNQSYTFHDELSLPSDLSSYDVIIATLGYYEC